MDSIAGIMVNEDEICPDFSLEDKLPEQEENA